MYLLALVLFVHKKKPFVLLVAAVLVLTYDLFLLVNVEKEGNKHEVEKWSSV